MTVFEEREQIRDNIRDARRNVRAARAEITKKHGPADWNVKPDACRCLYKTPVLPMIGRGELQDVEFLKCCDHFVDGGCNSTNGCAYGYAEKNAEYESAVKELARAKKARKRFRENFWGHSK